MQVDAKDFERVVTHRVMRMRGAYADPVSVPLAAKEAGPYLPLYTFIATATATHGCSLMNARSSRME